MKVLVTVGAGYIGSIITEELQNEGHDAYREAGGRYRARSHRA